MNQTKINEELILNYWKSWQVPDWSEMRSCLADQFSFGGLTMDSDEFVAMCQAGNPWNNVQLLSSIFNEHGGALLYEGYDTGLERVVRVGEFITVQDNLITGSIASFGTGQPPQ